MVIFMLICYIVTIILFIVTYIKCLKGKIKWYKLLLFESLAMLISYILMRYYDTLPGFGMMPGFTYFGETLLSLGAFYLFGIMLVVTFITYIIRIRNGVK